jgi:hypothetical protein
MLGLELIKIRQIFRNLKRETIKSLYRKCSGTSLLKTDGKTHDNEWLREDLSGSREG